MLKSFNKSPQCFISLCVVLIKNDLVHLFNLDNQTSYSDLSEVRIPSNTEIFLFQDSSILTQLEVLAMISLFLTVCIDQIRRISLNFLLHDMLYSQNHYIYLLLWYVK